MRRIAIAAMLCVLAPTFAYAQRTGPPTARDDKEKKEDSAIDKAYRDAVKRTDPGRSTKIDPWQSVRPAPKDSTKR
jgi:hypothetical protein